MTDGHFNFQDNEKKKIVMPLKTFIKLFFTGNRVKEEVHVLQESPTFLYLFFV